MPSRRAPAPFGARSSLCTQASFATAAYRRWRETLRLDDIGLGATLDEADEPLYLNRKVWEWMFIAEALHRRGMLRPGRRGLAFGVGTEPLVALFAGFGCEIVATDLDAESATEAGWVATDQHAAQRNDLNRHGICDPDTFDRLVSFRVVDMNAIPADLEGFDFCWSACAFEHLGDLQAGQRYVLEAMRCVRVGGVAVHTTEFNVSSNDDTIADGATVLYRRRDIEALVRELRREGHRIDTPDLDTGNLPADTYIDLPPYSPVHLKIRFNDFVTTSLGLVVERGDPEALVNRYVRAPLLSAGRRLGALRRAGRPEAVSSPG